MSEIVMNLAVVPAMKTFVWAFVFVVAVPVLITGGAVYVANKGAMFGITSSVTVLSIVLFGAFVYFLLRNEITLDAQTLTVKAAFYERSVSRSDIVWVDSHLVDFVREPGLSPGVRVNGIGLPGYRAGWFRLANGTRAFLLTTHGPLAYIAVRGGEDLLLSVVESSLLFEEIRSGGSEP